MLGLDRVASVDNQGSSRDETLVIHAAMIGCDDDTIHPGKR
jgi:hypothetical protein